MLPYMTASHQILASPYTLQFGHPFQQFGLAIIQPHKIAGHLFSFATFMFIADSANSLFPTLWAFAE